MVTQFLGVFVTVGIIDRFDQSIKSIFMCKRYKFKLLLTGSNLNEINRILRSRYSGPGSGQKPVYNSTRYSYSHNGSYICGLFLFLKLLFLTCVLNFSIFSCYGCLPCICRKGVGGMKER